MYHCTTGISDANIVVLPEFGSVLGPFIEFGKASEQRNHKGRMRWPNNGNM